MFHDMLASLTQQGARLIPTAASKADVSTEALCRDLLSRRGEATGLAVAQQILNRIEGFDEEELLEFATLLAERFDPDPDDVLAAAEDYSSDQSTATLQTLLSVSEPPRQELFRRLNQPQGGTEALVQFRERLLPLVKSNPMLQRIDTDLGHLFTSWFNRGFLHIKPIDWSTSADLLEKIIKYEAVHAIDSWEDLRARLQPSDRRCFAFFHPAMPDEPLIFVEVALTNAIATSIQDVLSEDRDIIPAESAKTAVFYSISNCQPGLRGISFGSFLIKQVARDLSQSLPGIETFVTLSPVPGLRDWIDRSAEKTPDGPEAMLVQKIADDEWGQEEGKAEEVRPLLTHAAARYLLEAKHKSGTPLDPVARFHLGNGASLKQINWLADVSAKGIGQSAGVMVNYLYDLAAIETNHEAFAEDGTIVCNRSVKSLLTPPKQVAAP